MTATDHGHALDEALAALRAGDEQSARRLAEQAASAAPDDPGARHLLGHLLAGQGEFAAALDQLEAADRLAPGRPEILNALGAVLARLDRPADARVRHQAALAATPDDVTAHMGLANLALARADHAAAVDHLDRLAVLMPDDGQVRRNLAIALTNRGIDLTDRGNFDAARAALERGLALEPGDAKARFNLGILLLLLGETDRGLDLYEARLAMTAQPAWPGRRWGGEALASEAILLAPEQGYGDAIQCARFLTEVARRGGRPILAVETRLERLFRDQGWDAEIVPRDRIPPDVPWHCPVMSLPRALGIDPARLKGTPYLRAEAANVTRWRDRLAADLPAGPRIGIAWAGNPTHRRDAARSLPFEDLRPLLDTAGTAFVSLQVGAAAPDGPAPLYDATASLDDFADTAALVSILDRVVSVDTAVLHLAGALGVPAWGLMPPVPDWRWGLTGGRTPWYDSVELIRADAAGGWPAVIDDLRRRLENGDF